MLSTTYNKFTELQVQLPVADADAQRNAPQEIIVSVASDGRYAVNRVVLEARSVEALSAALSGVAQSMGKQGIVIISADALSPHQSVIAVMEAARRSGLNQITFATQSTPK